MTLKMYIAVLDEVPDFMVPTLVAHSVINAHCEFQAFHKPRYQDWMQNSFRKVTVRVNCKEFDKIKDQCTVWLGHENTTLRGEKSCAVCLPMTDDERPKVLQYAKLWAPKCL